MTSHQAEIDQAVAEHAEKDLVKEVETSPSHPERATRSFMAAQKTQDAFWNALAALKPTKPIAPAYCDYIAHRIHDALSNTDFERLIGSVERVYGDLHPDGGYLLSTKKTIQVTDRNGTRYRVTVEEVTP